ncbi:MAG: hypothetical protein EA419_01100 [Wenzhouxiangella sp.]|nr:MAG: hypothetical protein EA419_01100 [Wenzhouxiangella sp.]
MQKSQLTKISLLLCLGAALLLPAALTAQPVPDDAPPGARLAYWFDQAARAFNEDRLDDWVTATERLHDLRPYNQDFMTHLVLGYARQNQLSKAFNTMLMMQQQGLAEDWSRFDELEPMRQHRLYEHLANLMSEARQPFGRYSEVTALPEDFAMPEALALDSATGRVFAGNVRDGRILVRSGDDDWEDFAQPDDVEGLMAVFDLAVDADRDHLWVATGMTSQFAGFDEEATVQSALLRLDLGSGELEASYPVPAGDARHLLGSLALADDGTVFAADTLNPVVFRLEAGSQQLQPFFSNANFSSLRGLALSADERLLYLADYEQGIFVLATDGSNQAWKLAVPETLNEGGIDGLYWWEQHLVAIQNGISPQRVLRLQLGEDGLGVTAVAPVLAGLEQFDTPTFGVMDGSELYLFSGSHWRHVDGRGQAREESLPQVSLLKTDVDATEIMVVGQEAMEQMRGR